MKSNTQATNIGAKLKQIKAKNKQSEENNKKDEKISPSPFVTKF